MRFTKKIIASAMTACLCICMGMTPAFAAGENESTSNIFKTYNYTISVYAGLGSFASGTDFVQVEPAPALGSQVDLSVYSTGEAVVLPDDKYYVKGIRLAGHDYRDDAAKGSVVDAEGAVSSPVFTVTGDAQYVVAYGLKKDQVAYTVNYVDAAGNQIADSQTFYGNAGDKPVVAFRYIDGYLPTAYNLTGTLKKDAANVFTFTYNAAPGVVYGEGETVVVDAGTTVTGAGAGAAAVGGAPAGAAAVAEAAAAGEVIGEDGTPLAAPQEIEDIDDDETPMAQSPEGFEGESATGVSPLLIGAGVAVLIAIIAVAIVVLRKRQTKTADQ